MSDKLENALVEVIEKANSGLDAASEFVMSELPDVIQQALTWYAVESFIFFCVGLVMILCAYKLAKWQYNVIYKEDGELTNFADDGYGLSVQGMVFCAVSGFLNILYLLSAVAWVSDLTWLKIWLAPKLWLIEYAAKLAS